MDTMRNCSGCGAPIAPDAPQGLCGKCLLKAGLGTGADVGLESASGAESGQARFVAPAPAELARLFPQLDILGMIGQGGMGAVYKARQKALDRVVALKILPPAIGQDPDFAERFGREAKALARLNHPNIVTLYEFGQADGLFYFLMEFVDGMNLQQLLRAGTIAPKGALAIVPHICDALQFAHDQGIVHRDIKPENILLGKDGQVKIADFGVAKIVAHERPSTAGDAPHAATWDLATESGRVVGTPQYMAPEQVSRPTEVDHRADIYSLGVVFYQMLTGELPGKPIESPSRRIQVDVRIDEIVLRALELEPQRRYQHASEVKTDVETITGRTTASSKETAEERPSGKPCARALSPARLWPVVAAESVVVSLVALVLGVAVIYVLRGGRGIPALLTVAVLALPCLGTIINQTLRRWWAGSQAGETPRGVYWLKAWGWTAWVLALPIGGFGVFFLHALLSETGGWHPGPDEAPFVAMTWLGAVLLPISGWILLRAAASPKEADWRTWAPFQSEQIREIRDHMTEAERREAALRGAFFGIWSAATFYIPFAIAFFGPKPVNWILAPLALALGLGFYPLWQRIMREFLASTIWARQQGITPESLRTPPRIVLVGRRGNRPAVHGRGVLLCFMLVLVFEGSAVLLTVLTVMDRIDGLFLGLCFALFGAVIVIGTGIYLGLRTPVDRLTPLERERRK